jgi:DNA repair protein SbcD/Mre11
MFRFIHTADLHLDSPLKALRRRNADLAEAVGVATRTAFERMVERAIDESVDAFLISGDLYDGTVRDVSTGLYLADCIRRLGKAGVHTLIVYGNHDAESVIKPPFADVDTLTVFKPTASTFRFEEKKVAVHGASFKDQHVPEDMTDRYPDPVSGWVNIGMLHTSLGGYSEHASYAPTTPSRLTDKGYDYWALGHVHKSRVIQDGTPQEPWIVYPGIPQGRDMGETGVGQAVLGTVENNRVKIEWFNVSPILLDRVSVVFDVAKSIDEIFQGAPLIAEAIIEAAGPDQSIIRPELEVPPILIPALHRNRDELLDMVQTNVQARVDRVAVEKIEFVPTTDAPAGTEDYSETVLALTELVRESAAEDDTLVNDIVKDLQGVLSRLPADIRSHPDLLNPVTDLGPRDSDDVGAWLEAQAQEAVGMITPSGKGDLA